MRTNKADNRFGPVESYAVHGCTPDNDARVVISGGAQQRLDVVLVCVRTGDFKTYARTTQSIAGLSLGASISSINHKKGGSVTYRVTDAGDPVAGATVSVHGRIAEDYLFGNGEVPVCKKRAARPIRRDGDVCQLL